MSKLFRQPIKTQPLSVVFSSSIKLRKASDLPVPIPALTDKITLSFGKPLGNLNLGSPSLIMIDGVNFCDADQFWKSFSLAVSM